MDEMEGKMTEEKKKRRIIKQIFKWLGLGLVVALIMGALIYDAPWKVLAFLLIILAACTILPKPAKKWFGLSVAAVVIVLILWVFLPDRNGGWRPFTFDEELATIKARYAVPDSENAAIAYNKLFESLDIDSNQPEFFAKENPSSRDGPWRSADHPETAEWLKSHQKTIDALMEISRIEKCRFPIAADLVSFGKDMPSLSKMRHCAFLLVSSANNDIAEGRIDAALEKWLCLIQMSKHLRQQPTMINMLVGIAIESLATRQFNRFAVTGDATEECLSIIEKALAEIKYDWSTDFPKSLEHEKLFAKNFWGMFYEVNPEGKIRLTRGLTNMIMAQLPQDMKDKAVITYWHKRIMKAWTILGWFYLPSTPQKAGEIIDAKYEKFYAMADPGFDWQKEAEKPTKMLRLNYPCLVKHLVGILEPAYRRIHDLYLRLYADRRGSRIIIALRRYKNKAGHWPESLDQVKQLVPAEILIDPYNGGPFVYKLTDDGFTLYSKGPNNIDEGGKYNPTWDANSHEIKVKEDDWLIWPPKRHKTKKENTDDEQQ
jgi:hypothetical protein